ncbi:hypothetical protein SteCoe_8650 [Stentor coeruleus]|uniref:Vacuolar fusion protein MON1 homolog n=1 Tax=Stentor coeruleus TaxID=5963 RepID=A0A1R2CJQ3_9CILI|nr:hypothetical protein SteCoe_8650 [Stentor coeruleus]
MEEVKVFQKKKLFFVFTSAGKPVWTRYGDAVDLSTFIGSLAAILFNFQNYYTNSSDALRYLRTSDMLVVFLCKEALFYVVICKISKNKQNPIKETLESLHQQLQNLHIKVISTLTNNITSTLQKRPNFDARNLMGGTHSALDTLVRTSAMTPHFLEGFMPVRLHYDLRNEVYQAFKNNMHEDILYAILMTPNFIIYRYCRKGNSLHYSDVSLLSNLLASYNSLRSASSWTPICLPQYSDEGFVYACITFIANSQISITLISENSNAFKDLKNSGDIIEAELTKIKSQLEDCIKQMPYSVSTCGIKEVKHFLYCSRGLDQYTMSGVNPSTRDFLPEIKKQAYKRLLKRYDTAYHLSIFSDYYKGNFTRIDIYRNEQILCIRTLDYTLLVSFSPLLSRNTVYNVSTQLLRWIKQEEPSLFIVK